MTQDNQRLSAAAAVKGDQTDLQGDDYSQKRKEAPMSECLFDETRYRKYS